MVSLISLSEQLFSRYSVPYFVISHPDSDVHPQCLHVWANSKASFKLVHLQDYFEEMLERIRIHQYVVIEKSKY